MSGKSMQSLYCFASAQRQSARSRLTAGVNFFYDDVVPNGDFGRYDRMQSEGDRQCLRQEIRSSRVKKHNLPLSYRGASLLPWSRRPLRGGLRAGLATPFRIVFSRLIV